MSRKVENDVKKRKGIYWFYTGEYPSFFASKVISSQTTCSNNHGYFGRLQKSNAKIILTAIIAKL